jgi:hypothetical protein
VKTEADTGVMLPGLGRQQRSLLKDLGNTLMLDFWTAALREAIVLPCKPLSESVMIALGNQQGICLKLLCIQPCLRMKV